MTHRIKKSIAVLVAGGLVAPAVAAHGAVSAATAARWHTHVDRLEVMINPNRNRSVAQRFTWLNNRLSLTGLINVDFAYFARGWNGGAAGMGGVVPAFIGDVAHSNDISVNNANLLADFKVNRFTTGHMSVVLHDVPGPGPHSATFQESSYDCPAHPQFTVDEAYVTLGNFAHSPFYGRFGRQYLPFGHYKDPYPLTKALTQLMSQTNANMAQFGFVHHHGMYGSLFAFNGPNSGLIEEESSVDYVSASRVRNWGAKLGYRGTYHHFLYELSGSFLRDFRDTDYFVSNEDHCLDYSDSRRSAAFSVYGSLRQGPFNFMANYVGTARSVFADDSHNETRPWAYTLLGGYRFYTYGHHSKLLLSYQRSGNQVSEPGTAANLPQGIAYMPRYRIQVTYNVVLGRYTMLVMQYNYNRNFTTAELENDDPDGDSVDHARNSNVAKVRLSVHF